MIDELLERSRAYTDNFSLGDLSLVPSKHVAVVACMDTRFNPNTLLGLREGEAHVIRNAGGLITENEIRSLAISQHLLGTREVMVIHHTDCGSLKLDEGEFCDGLAHQTGVRPRWPSGSFPTLEQSVTSCVATVLKSPFIPHKNVRGFIYEVETGRLREVI